MIKKYFVIMTKDVDGYYIPYDRKHNSTPELWPDETRANFELEMIRSRMKARLNPVPQKENRFGLFKKETVVHVSEEEKKEIRWFLANATVKGVTLHT